MDHSFVKLESNDGILWSCRNVLILRSCLACLGVKYGVCNLLSNGSRGEGGMFVCTCEG